MSTEYPILNRKEHGADLVLCEASCNVAVSMSYLGDDSEVSTNYLTADQLQYAIIRMIEMLSYISGDAEATLKRFNVNYGDKQ